MRFVSFFAGIGGFDLGLERAGHECVGQVEIDPYALRVLARHWPHVPRFGDVRTLDADALPDADLYCGGWPCQPFSAAGFKRGKHDERDLWPAWFGIIARRRPRWIFGENVSEVLTDDGGRTWLRTVSDLAAIGYVAEWTVLSLRHFGSPTLRRRLFLVAHRDDGGLEDEWGSSLQRKAPQSWLDANRRRLEGTWPPPQGAMRLWEGLPPEAQPAICCGAHGPSGGPDRQRLRLLGNIVSPVIVEAIARRVWG